MSNTLSPRPILKRTCSAERGPSPTPQNAVHFPPSPSLTRTFSVHSASSYDRSPIVVSTNTCALPERGCPGRTYALDDAKAAAQQPPPRGHAHPRAWTNNTAPPPLILDLSSESDESDGLASPPLFTSSAPSLSYPNTDSYIAHAASFPYHSSTSSLPTTPRALQPLDMSSTSRMGSFRRRKSPSGSPSYMMLETDPGYDDDDDTPTPSPSPIVPDREKRRSKKVSTMLSKKLSSFGLEDDGGCLGGF